MCVLKGDFLGFGCPNDAQTPCWLYIDYESKYWYLLIMSKIYDHIAT